MLKAYADAFEPGFRLLGEMVENAVRMLESHPFIASTVVLAVAGLGVKEWVAWRRGDAE